ncbi:MAG: hypothetical protein GQ583_06265 [Methyloprofundus sp.]|nr:hypothetical protein [Methyloprofundus sp.]
MKIFLSHYQNTSTPIVKRIGADLTEQGYDVWINIFRCQLTNDELSITLGMQNNAAIKVLLNNSEIETKEGGLRSEFIDMSDWGVHYNPGTRKWNESWYQSGLKKIIRVLNEVENQRIFKQRPEDCYPEGEQWYFKIAKELWSEFIKVEGEPEQLSRYALYELPNILMSISRERRAFIVGGREGWEENAYLVGQVCIFANSQCQRKLGQLWNELDVQLDKQLLGL